MERKTINTIQVLLELAVNEMYFALEAEEMDEEGLQFTKDCAQRLDEIKNNLMKLKSEMFGMFKPSLQPDAVDPNIFLDEVEDI